MVEADGGQGVWVGYMVARLLLVRNICGTVTLGTAHFIEEAFFKIARVCLACIVNGQVSLFGQSFNHAVDAAPVGFSQYGVSDMDGGDFVFRV